MSTETEKGLTNLVDPMLADLGALPLQHFLVESVERIDAIYSDGKDDKILFGIPNLDRATMSLEGGNIVVIAGRPKSGSTLLALTIARNAVVEQKIPTLIISMMKNGRSIAERLISMTGRFNGVQFRKGFSDDQVWPHVSYGVTLLNEALMAIMDRPGQTLNDVLGAMKGWKALHSGKALIVLDGMSMLLANTRVATGVHEYDIASPLKNLARELDVPIVVTAAIDSAVEQRPNKRPCLRDLMPKTQLIENVADTILLLYRESLYEGGKVDDGLIEANIAKQEGPSETIFMHADWATNTLLGESG